MKKLEERPTGLRNEGCRGHAGSGVWQRLRPACRETLPVAAERSLAGRPCALSELSMLPAAAAVKEGSPGYNSQATRHGEMHRMLGGVHDVEGVYL